MRTIIDPQMKFGEQAIAAIELDPKSRDDIPQILRGLQPIYTTTALRERVFAILEEVIPDRVGEQAQGKADPNTGRPGMAQWKILVLGTLRTGLNADYDRLQELANQHNTVRKMLGHGDWADDYRYPLQTLKDNLRLFTPEILDRINHEVVRAGQVLVKKSSDEGISARCDSFVVETDVHFPTDTNLLFDAIRKTLQTCADLSEASGLSDWRQSAYHLRRFKKAYRTIQRLRHSNSKDQTKREAKRLQIEAAHQAYLEQAEGYLERARTTLRYLELNATATTLLVVSPWTVRNCRVMDGCAFVSTNAGWNLAIGSPGRPSPGRESPGANRYLPGSLWLGYCRRRRSLA